MERAGSSQNFVRKRSNKAAVNEWKAYVDNYGSEFVQKFSGVISVPNEDAGDVETRTSVCGVTWIASCHLAQAVPLPDCSGTRGNNETSDEFVVLSVKDKTYRCHSGVLRESVYLATMLSMRWIECVGSSDDDVITLQLDERMFLPTLHALYGWIPAVSLDASAADHFEWLASTADFCSVSALNDHLRARLDLLLLPEAEANARGNAARLPVEDLLRVLPVCRHLGVQRPLVLLSSVEVLALWWRSTAGVEAMMRIGAKELEAVLAEASARTEAAFDKWFDVFRQLDRTLACSLDASSRGHQRRHFLSEMRPLLTSALVRHASAFPAPALDTVAALWRGARHMRDVMHWDGAEAAWAEVTSQPDLGPVLLAALESILAGKRVTAWWENASDAEMDALQREVEDRVPRALRVLLPYVMQTDVWKCKTGDMKRALLRELNYFGTEAASPLRSQGVPRSFRLGARSGSRSAGVQDTSLPNSKFASTISKQVATTLKTRKDPVDVSGVTLPPSKTFSVSFDWNAPLRWSNKKD